VLYRALQAAGSQVLFIDTLARAHAVDESAFAPFETAILEAPYWEPLEARAIQLALNEKPIELQLEGIGLVPMGDAAPPPPGATE
jgi:hypothetical protein